MKRKLIELAFAQNGDKGDNLNIAILARDDRAWDIIREKVTADVVRDYFKGYIHGDVTRYEMPNIQALNFVLRQALAGGATQSLRLDIMGRNSGQALLQMELDG